MSQVHTSNSQQAAWVAIGSFFSFIIGIVSPMILSRFFDKGDYGTYKQVMYVYNTLLIVFTLGLPRAYAYFLPKYKTIYSRDIINKVTRIFFILGAIFSLVLLLSAGFIASVLNNPDLEVALIYFSPTPFLLLPTMGLDAIYASFKKTRYVAYYTIFTKILTILCIVIPVVIFSGNYIHAIIGFDFASFMTFCWALYLKTWPVQNIDHQKSSLSYKEIFRFSMPLLYASLWGVIISSANQFFISRYFGTESFAEFSNGFMELPFVGMILSSISTVLLPVFSGMDKGNGMNNQTLAIWNSALLKSAKLIFPMLIFSIFFARILMTCMYGDLYQQSTIYFIIKNVSGLFYIIPFYPIILAIGKTREYANVHMAIAFLIVIVEYFICKIFSSAIYVAIISEICQVMKILLLLQIISNYAQKKVQELIPLKPLIVLIGMSILASFLPFLLITYIPMNKFVALFIGLLLFIIIYYVLCWIFRVTYKDVVVSLFGNNLKQKILLKVVP